MDCRIMIGKVPFSFVTPGVPIWTFSDAVRPKPSRKNRNTPTQKTGFLSW